MKDQIVLHQDEDGNYFVDIIGLMYLLKTNALPDGTQVLAIFESGEETEYAVISDGETSILCYEGMEELVFGLDEDSIHAFYEVTINEPKEKDSVLPRYEQIHYEEALTRMKNGEKVYLDYGDYDMTLVDNQKTFSPEAVLNGIWFTSEAIKGVKKTKSVPERPSNLSPDTLFDRLEKFLQAEEMIVPPASKEKKDKKQKKNKKKKKTSSKTEADMEQMLEQMFKKENLGLDELLSSLEDYGFELEILDLDDFNPEDFEDYI